GEAVLTPVRHRCRSVWCAARGDHDLAYRARPGLHLLALSLEAEYRLATRGRFLPGHGRTHEGLRLVQYTRHGGTGVGLCQFTQRRRARGPVRERPGLVQDPFGEFTHTELHLGYDTEGPLGPQEQLPKIGACGRGRGPTQLQSAARG